MKKQNKSEENEIKAAPAYQNKVTLVGYLGDVPEQRNQHATFSLATKVSWKPKDSAEWIERTEWHRIIAWGKLAEAVKPLTKGDHILVEGELRSSSYEKEVSTEGGGTARVSIKSWEIRANAVRKMVHKKAEPSASKKGGAA